MMGIKSEGRVSKNFLRIIVNPNEPNIEYVRPVFRLSTMSN
jgi:hypothetical protein